MPGIFISNFGLTEIVDSDLLRQNYIYRKETYGDVIAFQYTLDRFMGDKIFFKDTRFFLVTEGVLLNCAELKEKYCSQSLSDLIIEMYTKNGDQFFAEFRGSFSGILCDFEKKKQIIYTNHYGDNALFYYKDIKNYVVGAQLDWLVEVLKVNNVKTGLNEKAVYEMITYGYMAEDITYIEEIKRLPAGCYIVISEDSFEVKRYYEVKQNKLQLSNKGEDEIIEEIDKLFRRAVKREFDKDREYGYRHLIELSGGLDSRMNYWVANDMGFDDSLAICFCQSNYADELIAKQIAGYWNGEILLWPLDSGANLYDIEKCAKLNFGCSLYSGVGGELHILENINMSKYGLMHTGQLGDVVIGTFVGNNGDMRCQKGAGAYSEMLLREYDDDIWKNYRNIEEQLMNVRGFWGCLSSHFFTRNYTEVASPFLDVDLIDYCMSIPNEMRKNHKIYKKWIVSKYPDAAQFKWEKTDGKITDSKFTSALRKKIREGRKMLRDPRRILAWLGINSKKYHKRIDYGMNPLDLWYMKNTNLREYMDNFFTESLYTINISKKLVSDIELLYHKGNAIEKTQVLTALAAVKYLWKECFESVEIMDPKREKNN